MKARQPSLEARRQLQRLGLRAAKGLGQHFLVDSSVLDVVVSAADLRPEDVVVEVGPGLGILTGELVRRVERLVAVEVDARLVDALRGRFPAAGGLTLLNADVLDLDPARLVADTGNGAARAYKVVANLPYYVGSAIIRHFLESSCKPTLMVVMVQKEVAESMAAVPGGMSILGVSVQLYARPTIVASVPAESFYPKPKVDSAVVRLDVYREPALELEDKAAFFEVVRAGFGAPRKQLRNSLAVGWRRPAGEIANLLEGIGIDPRRRAETLSLQEWERLYRAYSGI